VLSGLVFATTGAATAAASCALATALTKIAVPVRIFFLVYNIMTIRFSIYKYY
jgi:hypothetical protein